MSRVRPADASEDCAWGEGVVPRVQSNPTRALHACRGMKLLEHHRNQKIKIMQESNDRFRRARKKGAMAFLECMVISQRRYDGGLPVVRNLRWEPGIARCGRTSRWDKSWYGCQKETTCLHAISCTKIEWSSLTPNRVFLNALARSLRERKVQLIIEDT